LLICQLIVYLYRISEKSFPLSSLNQSISKTVIVDIQNYIDDHFMEEISLKDMAGMFHTNMYYLCHLFKEMTGTTFKNYLIQRRVSYAKDMLCYTNKDIAEIVAETGFGSVNHFIRAFKKTVGITPHQYRKNSRKGTEGHELEKGI
jgi:YesN/AraC family two-component response regulator